MVPLSAYLAGMPTCVAAITCMLMYGAGNNVVVRLSTEAIIAGKLAGMNSVAVPIKTTALHWHSQYQQMLSAMTLHVQAHTNASSVFDAGVDTMSVKLTIKRMQGYAAPKKAAKLNMALISRLKLLGKAARDKASLLGTFSIYKVACNCTCSVGNLQVDNLGEDAGSSGTWHKVHQTSRSLDSFLSTP